MSDNSESDLYGLDFEDRTTNDRFNERLLQARDSIADDDQEEHMVGSALLPQVRSI